MDRPGTADSGSRVLSPEVVDQVLRLFRVSKVFSLDFDLRLICDDREGEDEVGLGL